MEQKLKLIILVLLTAVVVDAAWSQTSDPALNVLIKKGIITEEEAKKAVADLEKEKAKPATPIAGTEQRAVPSTAPAEKPKLWGDHDVRFFWKEGLNFQSGDGKTFKGKIGGRMQYDVADIEEDDTVEAIAGHKGISSEFRRARLYTSGEINQGVPFYYILQMEFAGGDTKFADAYLGVREIPYVGSIQVGQMYEPFSLEQNTSDNYVTLPERAAPIEAFSPARNVGGLIQNLVVKERVTYALGVFADDENDKADGDAFESNTRVTARVTGLPWYDAEHQGRRYFHLGVGGSVINPENDIVRYRTRPEAHLAPRYVDTGPFEADMAYLGGVEALLTYESFSLQSEYIQTWLESSASGNPTFNGFYVMGTWFLTGEYRPYKKSGGVLDRVIPKRPFSFTGSGPGALQLIGRVSQVDLDSGDIRGGRLTDYTAGLSWYLNTNAKIILNYIYAQLDRAGEEGHSDIIQTRFQVDF